jgi:hypothetical protein
MTRTGTDAGLSFPLRPDCRPAQLQPAGELPVGACTSHVTRQSDFGHPWPFRLAAPRPDNQEPLSSPLHTLRFAPPLAYTFFSAPATTSHVIAHARMHLSTRKGDALSSPIGGPEPLGRHLISRAGAVEARGPWHRPDGSQRDRLPHPTAPVTSCWTLSANASTAQKGGVCSSTLEFSRQ